MNTDNILHKQPRGQTCINNSVPTAEQPSFCLPTAAQPPHSQTQLSTGIVKFHGEAARVNTDNILHKRPRGQTCINNNVPTAEQSSFRLPAAAQPPHSQTQLGTGIVKFHGEAARMNADNILHNQEAKHVPTAEQSNFCLPTAAQPPHSRTRLTARLRAVDDGLCDKPKSAKRNKTPKRPDAAARLSRRPRRR